MRKQVIGSLCLLLATAFFLSGCSTDSYTSSAADSKTPGKEVPQVGKNKPGKVLVVYYSLTGNTRNIGNIIKDMTGAEVFEIEPVENYWRSDIEEVAKKQVSEGYKPKLKNTVSDINKYDMIFIGSPVWWFSVSPPVMSFLSQYDFKDKKVVPFCTYGTDYGNFFDMFEKACPGAKVFKGVGFSKAELQDTEKVKEKIKLWLEEVGGV